MRALAVIFGTYALVDGAATVGSALTHASRGERLYWADLLAGSAGLLAGTVSLLWPGITRLALVVLVGAWAIISGLLEVIASVTHLLDVPSTRPGRVSTGEWLLAVAGITTVAAGLVVLARPDAAPVALATVLALYGLISGAVLLTAAWCLRKWPVVAEVG